MNLYEVSYCVTGWGVFCFAPSANKAKYMVAKFYDSDYAAMRCKTIKKGMCVPYAAVVDNEKHELYPKITEIGLRYMTIDEMLAGDLLWENNYLAGVEDGFIC